MPTLFKGPMNCCVLALMLVGFSPARLLGQSPLNSGSREFVDAFVTTERAKLIDKVQKEGDKFDASREMDKLQQKHMKVFGEPMSVPLLAEFDRTARETPLLTPEQLQQIDPGSKRGPTESSPELFIANAKVKFMEDIREEGARFDLNKQLSKVSETYEKNFGSPLPPDLRDAVLRSAYSAREAITQQRAKMAQQLDAAKRKSTTTKSKSKTARSRPVVRGVRYPEGLPDWFIEADRDHDGQVGLYEFDRSRFEEFKHWDCNGDGLLEPQEVLRATAPTTPAANDNAASPK